MTTDHEKLADYPTHPCRKCGGKLYSMTCKVMYEIHYDLVHGEDISKRRNEYSSKYWHCVECNGIYKR